MEGVFRYVPPANLQIYQVYNDGRRTSLVPLIYPSLLAHLVLMSSEDALVPILIREEGNMSNQRQNLNQVLDVVVDPRIVRMKG